MSSDSVVFAKISTGPSAELIREHLKRLCESKEFHTKEKLCTLLCYVVEETLAGRADQLKGYTIGVEVLKRGTNFNPDLDPIVRIQAGRVRRSLELYYAGEGKNDSIRFFIPKGAYVPIFIPQNTTDRPSFESYSESKHESGDVIRPAIAVLPFQNLTGDPEQDYFVRGFTEELSIELTRYEDFQIIGYHPASLSSESEDSRTIGKNVGAHFVIEGSIRKDERQAKISIKVIDTETGEHIWGEHYRRDLTVDSLIAIQEEIVREAIANIASEYGVIPNKLTKEAKKKRPNAPSTYDAILRFYYHETQFTAKSYRAAFNALEHAVHRDPECGIAVAMLAEMYATKYSLGLPDSDGALEKALELSRQAVQTDPDNQLVRIISAANYFHMNERELFFLEMEKALALNPNSPLRIGGIGFFLCLYGEWERGKALLDRAMKQNIGYPLIYHGATTTFYYRQHDYESAYKEALQYNVAGVFWGPMLRVACLGQLQRPAEVEQHISYLLQLRPNFQKKARMLISRYVKEDELVDHIMDGLRKAGLAV